MTGITSLSTYNKLFKEFSTYQTLLIVMVAFSEDNRAFVFISSIVSREAAFDFKSGTIGKLSVMTIANPAGASAGKL